MLQTREIGSSRLKFVSYLAISLAFVGLTVWLIKDGNSDEHASWAWFGLSFFGLCSSVFVWLLIRPQRLLLDREGFTLLGGFIRSPKQVKWKDISEFFVYDLPRGGAMIGYNFRPGSHPGSALIKLNRRFGAEAALPRGWPMSLDEMVEELNDYRARALSWAN